MNLIKRHLPEMLYSRHNLKAEGAVIHYISAINITPDDLYNVETIEKIFYDYGVSAHYGIDRNGDVYEWVPPHKQAWHAGRSIMNGRESCNRFTIGIELFSTGEDFTQEQIISCIELTHNLPSGWIHGHDEVRAAWNKKYPNKKSSVKKDPGDNFPWNLIRD